MNTEVAERHEAIHARQKRIAEIDKMFEEATGWGSWMVTSANEREHLVNELAEYYGVVMDHKWRARCGNSKTD